MHIPYTTPTSAQTLMNRYEAAELHFEDLVEELSLVAENLDAVDCPNHAHEIDSLIEQVRSYHRLQE